MSRRPIFVAEYNVMQTICIWRGSIEKIICLRIAGYVGRVFLYRPKNESLFGKFDWEKMFEIKTIMFS